MAQETARRVRDGGAVITSSSSVTRPAFPFYAGLRGELSWRARTGQVLCTHGGIA